VKTVGTVNGDKFYILFGVMNFNKATNEEGFQADFFNHSLHALDEHMAALSNHVSMGFPGK
jgi:hypothetical protein